MRIDIEQLAHGTKLVTIDCILHPRGQMRLALTIAIVLASAARAQGPSSDKVFSDVYRAETLRFFGNMTYNSEAAEAVQFLRTAPDLMFERESPQAQAGAAAAYFPARRSIVLSDQALAASGIDPRINPEYFARNTDLLANSIVRIAPVLVHELTHARVHAELGFHPPVLENELFAYATESLYVAHEPSLATLKNYDAGLRALKDYSPLFIKHARLQREQSRIGTESLLDRQKGDESAAAQAERLWEGLGKQIDDSERQIRLQEVELANTLGIPYQTLMSLMTWATYGLGWSEFLEAVAPLVPLPSVNSSEEAIAKDLAMHQEIEKSLKGTPELTSNLIEANARDAAFWRDTARRGSAKAYFDQRLAPLRAKSGRGFEPAPTPPQREASASAKFNWSRLRWGRVAVLLAAVLAMLASAVLLAGKIRRSFKARAMERDLISYLHQHQATFGLAALRENLIKEGYPLENIDAAIEAVRGKGPSNG